MESIYTDRDTRVFNIPEYKWDFSKMEVVWGIPTAVKRKDIKATQYDCELIRHKDTGLYTFDIDVSYGFETDKEKVKYLRRLLKAFTKWMTDMGYSTNYVLPYYDVFSDKVNTDTSFKTIEACYANFKMFVTGYISLITKP